VGGEENFMSEEESKDKLVHSKKQKESAQIILWCMLAALLFIIFASMFINSELNNSHKVPVKEREKKP
jgi:hypothetical protein